MVNSKLPSYSNYNTTSFIKQSGFKLTKMAMWYLGITEKTAGYNELLELMENNNQFALIENQDLLKKYKSYLDPIKIPNQYKLGKSYYHEYESNKNKIYPVSKLNENNVLIENAYINTQIKKLFHHEISPLLADEKYLVGLPKAYFIILEWDELKDEGLLYAERLKENNVEVKVAFYEKGFHGMALLVGKQGGFQAARKIQSDLIEYMKFNL
jgi:acetyl esterase/lipase